MKICESGPVICRASGQASADTLNETCPCLTCDHEAPIVAGAYCMAGNFVDRNTNQNGCGVRENASFTLNTVDRHAVAYDARHLLYGDMSERSWWEDAATPKRFADDLAALGDVKEITVYINSGGGDVFAAQAIGNMLERNAATVTAHIDGLCASAATIVACHADKVVAAADSSYMVHPVSMGVCDYLTAEDLNNCLKALETIRSSIVTLYAKKSGKTEDECAKWMDETNWWTATEAKEKGFVDEVDDEADDSVVENRNGILFVNSICAAPMHWLSKSTLQSSGCTTGKSTRRKILYGRYMRAGPLEIRRPCA